MNEKEIDKKLQEMTKSHRRKAIMEEYVSVPKQPKKEKTVSASEKIAQLKITALALAATIVLGVTAVGIMSEPEEQPVQPDAGISSYQDYIEYAKENNMPINGDTWEFYWEHVANQEADTQTEGKQR